MSLLVIIVIFWLLGHLFEWFVTEKKPKDSKETRPPSQGPLPVIPKVERHPLPKASILRFESTALLNSVIAGDEIGFEWEVVGADRIYLEYDGNRLEVHPLRHCVCRLYRSQVVRLCALNPDGQSSYASLSIKVIPLPKMDFRVPFPEVSSRLQVDIPSPTLPIIEPPIMELPVVDSGILHLLAEADFPSLNEPTSIDSNTHPSSI